MGSAAAFSSQGPAPREMPQASQFDKVMRQYLLPFLLVALTLLIFIHQPSLLPPLSSWNILASGFYSSLKTELYYALDSRNPLHLINTWVSGACPLPGTVLGTRVVQSS